MVSTLARLARGPGFDSRLQSVRFFYVNFICLFNFLHRASFCFVVYFIFIYAFSYFTISKFQSIHYNNLHFIISNSHYKSNFVSSAVSVDSSPLETVSDPSLSLTSLKFINWLVLWDDNTQDRLEKTGIGGAKIG